eukprot:g36337.t1
MGSKYGTFNLKFYLSVTTINRQRFRGDPKGRGHQKAVEESCKTDNILESMLGLKEPLLDVGIRPSSGFNPARLAAGLIATVLLGMTGWVGRNVMQFSASAGSSAGSSGTKSRAETIPAPGPLQMAPPAWLDGAKVLIIQNKGGGHGEIGYHLALQLAAKKMAVTVLVEGANKGKPLQKAYESLGESGIHVKFCPSFEDSKAVLDELGSEKFTVVVDNWSKSPDVIRPYAEAAKAWGVKQYLYVSSAGMYSPPKGDYSAITEECAVKKTGQREAEMLLEEMNLPFIYFRPQYIYGPKQDKSYLEFFFDRLTRGRKVPVPQHGMQSLTFTHAADNAAMITAAIGNGAAVGEAFNCATSSLISYHDLVVLCAKATAAKDTSPKAVMQFFDPKDKPEGFKFPFRDTPFFVSVDKAKRLLNFSPKHTIEQDIGWYFSDNYVAKGGMYKEVDFADDEKLGLLPG